jgi:hypothetical protein
MNLREGTRRLALLLGAAGAILGAVLSYDQLQSDLHQRAEHKRFEQLANTPVVKQERARRISQLWTPVPTRDGPVTVIGPDGKTYHFPAGTDKDAAIRYFKTVAHGASGDVTPKFDPTAPYQAVSPQPAHDGRKSMPEKPDFVPADSDQPSIVADGGIAAIRWKQDFQVESIETQDGQTLYSTPAPSATWYLLIAILPILGFFFPWGAIRAVGWVLAGFLQPSK